MYTIKGQLTGHYTDSWYVECVVDLTENWWVIATDNAVQAKSVTELINYPIPKAKNLKTVWIEGPRGGMYSVKTGKLIRSAS